MKIVIFIDEKILTNYRSNLFPLFAPKLADRFIVTASFNDYRPALFPVFTDLSDYVLKVISEKKIDDYGLVLDARRIRPDETGQKIIGRSRFIFVLGPDQGQPEERRHCRRADCLYTPPAAGPEETPPGLALTELESLEEAYRRFEGEDNPPASLHVFCPPPEPGRDQWPELRVWRQKFGRLKIKLVCHWPTKAVYDYLVGRRPYFAGTPGLALGLDLGRPEAALFSGRAMTVDDFADELEKMALQTGSGPRPGRAAKPINIVCHQPTYLFKDLVERFVAKGCAHSDFPGPEAGAYIWMRPQELGHLDLLLQGRGHGEIPKDYAKAAPQAAKGLDMARIRARSVAIHHGACHEPIYQFCPFELALALRSAARVVGVCRFEECYGPAHEVANRDNFDFVPIGYDQRLFTENLVNQERRSPGARLNIGFVGRAYGTSNRNLLTKSRLAEPKGYRKGGDALLALANQLKLGGLDFELHIIGDNWDEAVERLKANRVRVRYHIRGVDLDYRDYPELYRRLDVLLITSRCEGGPVSALEALSLGVKVVGSRVGLIGFLEDELKGSESVFTYEYDRKWMLFDLDKAAEHLANIYKSPVTYQDRLRTRSLVEHLTMDRWVDHIYDQADRLRRNG